MATWVVLLCIVQVLFWGSAFALFYSAPAIDSAEQFAWAFSLESGYWKHPPAPTWIMHGLLALFGPSVALPFFAAQTCIAIALALTWRLGCEFMSPRRALIAMLLTSLVTYYNFGGDNFNHNTALLPFQAAAVLLFYRATREGGWQRWALSGLFAGLSLLVKYVALLPLCGLLVYLLLDRRRHHRHVFFGLAMAVAVCALVVAPHALWLHQTDFLPFRYARSVAPSTPGLAGALQSVADFLAIQGVRVLPLLLGLLWVVRGTRRPSPRPATTTQADPGDRLFLWIATLSPLVLTVAFSLATRTELQSRWGTNAFLLSGVLALSLWRGADGVDTMRRALAITAAAHLVFAAALTAGRTTLTERLHRPTRANFPGAVLAAEAHKVWSAHSRAPLRIVVSDIWLGGNIVAHNRQRIAVLIDGRQFKSPWVTLRALEGCGALVLDDLSSQDKTAPNPALDALMARARVTGEWNLPWAMSQSEATKEGAGRVRWGIIEPREGATCELQ